MASNRVNLNQQISVLPDLPGVYEFFDVDNRIIYIGKTKNLKKRVTSYFNKIHDSFKTRNLVKNIVGINYIVVDSETEALLLENNLIKKYLPRYNVMLKDDKTYPWICLKKERFPRVFMTRKLVDDGSKYFGPYSSVRMVRTILSLIKHIYKPRSCKHNLSADAIYRNSFKVCLEYHIGNCNAPCIGRQSENDYNNDIDKVLHILKGNIKEVISLLKDEMFILSGHFDFEGAQKIKEKVELLEQFKIKSTVVSPVITDIEVFSFVGDDKYAFVNFMKVIDGAVIQSQNLEIKKRLNESKSDLLSLAIAEIRQSKWYTADTTKEIVLPFKLDFELEGLHVTIPQRGDKLKLLELSTRNAKYFQLDKLKQIEKINPLQKVERILTTVKKDLNLTELPKHIECFDNSNLQGTNAVSSCVVFRNCRPSKKEYRHFKVKTVKGIDDFATMEEVVYRRYKRLVDENLELPQLIIIDGGKGQLSAATNSLIKLNILDRISIIGIAKKLEEIFKPGDSLPLYIDKNSEALKIIQQARDEAHRFGVAFHRLLRSKNFTKSELENIEGIGDKTIAILVKNLKSIKRIEKASLDDLNLLIGTAKAKLVLEYFKNKV